MNISTGELFRLQESQREKLRESYMKDGEDAAEAFKRMFGEDTEPVPGQLQSEAEKELGFADSVTVDMDRNTPLTKWAKKRKKDKKSKRKMIKASRKRNRGK